MGPSASPPARPFELAATGSSVRACLGDCEARPRFGGTNGTPAAYNKDTRRSAHLVSVGYRVMPISWEMWKNNPKKVIELVRDALKNAGARIRRRPPLDPAVARAAGG